MQTKSTEDALPHKKFQARFLLIAKQLKRTLASSKIKSRIYCSRTSSSVYVHVYGTDRFVKAKVRISDHPQDYVRQDNAQVMAFATIQTIDEVQEIATQIVEQFFSEQKHSAGSSDG